MVIVPHPIGGQDEATIREWADAAVEPAIAQFTGAAVSTAGRGTGTGLPPSRVALGTAFDEIRSLIAADGGDMLLQSVEGSTVNLELVVSDAHCAECVLPRPYLEDLCLDIIGRHASDFDRVRIDDPRERPGWSPAHP